MDCYYHGYSGGPGGRCVGCEQETDPDHKTFDDRAERGRVARMERDRERDKASGRRRRVKADAEEERRE